MGRKTLPLSIPSTYGNLTLLEDLGTRDNTSGYRRRFAKVKCVCGIIVEREVSKVISNSIKSCGCLANSAENPIHLTHGLTSKRAYGVWKAMRGRCNNPNAPKFKDYGGRGITVCAEWDSFEEFYSYMGEPEAGQSLNRVDNSLGYFPENCEWAGSHDQARNKRNNIFLEYNGKSQCLSDWARELGIPRKTLAYRIDNGWPLEKALNKLTKGVIA